MNGEPGKNIDIYAPNASGSNLIRAEKISDSTFIGQIINQAQPPNPPTGIPSNLPYRGKPPEKFFGREERLKEIDNALKEDHALAICAVAGMGGIGKTELAVQYAIRSQEEYPAGLCWLSGRVSDLGFQIVNFALTKLGLVIPDYIQLPEQQLEYCWNHWREGDALIVYDDVVDYRALVYPILPPGNQARFKVLMTSREKPGENYRKIDLEVLDEDSALDLLRSLVGSERVTAEWEGAKALCEWLGYLPLGLELVGRYLAKDRTRTIETVQKRLNSKRLQAKALIPDGKGDSIARLGVAAAFELSWEELPRDARELACRLSLFAPAPIPWVLVENCALADAEDRDEAAEELEELRNGQLIDRSLLEINEENHYRLHPLIREFFIAKQGESENIDDYKRDLCRVMAKEAEKIPGTVTVPIMRAITVIIPHLEEVGEKLTDWLEDEDLIWPCFTLASIYEARNQFDTVEKWYRKSLDVAKQRFGEEHPAVATSLNNLAYLYRETGRYGEAEPLYRQALEMRKRLLGEEHPDVATSLNNLAYLYRETGRYGEADPLLRQALEMRKRLLGEEHLDVAMSLNNLAELYRETGRYGEAEPLYRQALEMGKRLLGEE
ncbi:tetratricopeptide repeat protein, partial [Pannus brasiliensis CCIBt3594]